MAFSEALNNAKKKGGKKIPPKGKSADKSGKSKGFSATLANAKKKKKGC